MNPELPVPDEPFSESLLLGGLSASNDTLKEAVFQKTAATLRRRRRLKVAARCALFAAVFFGGMGAMAMVNMRQSPETRQVFVYIPQESKPHDEQKSQDPNSHDERKSPDAVPFKEPKRTLSPSELELQAEQTLVKTESARRFREAGDRYLREEANYQAALRCYRNYLDETEEANPAVSDSDTWLLNSLVNARRKENANVQFDR